MQDCMRIRGRSAKRVAIKWLAAPRAGPRERISPISTFGVHFLPPNKSMPPASPGRPVA